MVTLPRFGDGLHHRTQGPLLRRRLRRHRPDHRQGTTAMAPRGPRPPRRETMAERIERDAAGSAPLRGGPVHLGEFLTDTWLPTERGCSTGPAPDPRRAEGKADRELKPACNAQRSAPLSSGPPGEEDGRRGSTRHASEGKDGVRARNTSSDADPRCSVPSRADARRGLVVTQRDGRERPAPLRSRRPDPHRLR